MLPQDGDDVLALNDSDEATIRKLDDQSNRLEGECPCSSIG